MNMRKIRVLIKQDRDTISEHIIGNMMLSEQFAKSLFNNYKYVASCSFIDSLNRTIKENKDCGELTNLPEYLNEIISSNSKLKDSLYVRYAIFYDVTLYLLTAHIDCIVHDKLSHIIELTYDTTLGSYMNEYAYEDSDFDVRRFVHSLILLFCGTALIEWDYIAYIKEEFFHHNPRYQHLK